MRLCYPQLDTNSVILTYYASLNLLFNPKITGTDNYLERIILSKISQIPNNF
jgi:hypothetical protein